MGKNLKGKELGTGIIQRKDEIYCARYVDRFGKRKVMYNRSLRDLKAALNDSIYEDKNKMNICDDKITLDEWYKKWLEIHKYKVIRENTKRHYVQVYEKHISPNLGKFKLNEITQLQIKGLIKKLDKAGYKYETKNKVKILLLDMFNKAMIDDFASKNPARGIKITRDEEKDIRVLTQDEQVTFFDACKGTFYDNLFTVAVSTGLRPGEICALRAEDIDFDKAEISVVRTLLYQKLDGDTKKTFHIELPKTKTSIRKVPINKQCSVALKKQIMQKNVLMSKSNAKPLEGYKDLLFTTKYSTPINAQIYCDAIKAVVDEINLCRDDLEQFEMFSGHCFRHSFATRCFEAGIQPKTVQNYLGHATLQMTMDLYTSVLEDYKKEEMSKLEIVLDSVSNSSDDLVEKTYEKTMAQMNNVVNMFGTKLV